MYRAVLAIAVMLASMILPFKAALALSCAQPDDQQIIENSDLIVKARITDIEEPLKILNNPRSDKIITFGIEQVYRGDKDLAGQEIKAQFPNFMNTWGPQLEEGQEGEYIFDFNEKNEEWFYAGPGGCTFLSEPSWAKLRTHAHPPSEN